MTDPDLVFLLYDTGHRLLGEDPIYILKKYLPASPVHLKDIRMDIATRSGKA